MFVNVFMSFIHLYKPFFCPSVCQSVYWFVTKLFLRLFVASSKVFLNVLVCSFFCLADFSESADARDLGLMTLFLLSRREA